MQNHPLLVFTPVTTCIALLVVFPLFFLIFMLGINVACFGSFVLPNVGFYPGLPKNRNVCRSQYNNGNTMVQHFICVYDLMNLMLLYNWSTDFVQLLMIFASRPVWTVGPCSLIVVELCVGLGVLTCIPCCVSSAHLYQMIGVSLLTYCHLLVVVL